MKNKILYNLMLLFALFITSCNENQDYPPNPGEELIEITFNISPFEVNVDPIISRSTASGADINEVVSEIHYYITKDSQIIKSGSSVYDPDTPDQNFGVVKENLSPGSYYVYFYALGKGNGNATLNLRDIRTPYFTHSDKEVFLYMDYIEINPGSPQIDISVSRQSALLRINITDDVPEYVSKVIYSIKDSYLVYLRDYQSEIKSKELEAHIANNRIETLDYYFSFGAVIPQQTLHIWIYDTNNNLISDREVPIKIYQNKRTIVTGKLFSSLGDKDLQIEIKDLWDGDVEYPLD